MTIPLYVTTKIMSFNFPTTVLSWNYKIVPTQFKDGTGTDNRSEIVLTVPVQSSESKAQIAFRPSFNIDEGFLQSEGLVRLKTDHFQAGR